MPLHTLSCPTANALHITHLLLLLRSLCVQVLRARVAVNTPNLSTVGGFYHIEDGGFDVIVWSAASPLYTLSPCPKANSLCVLRLLRFLC